MDIQHHLESAKSCLMDYWPLQSFIATNPLWNLRDQAFFDVVSRPELNSLMPLEYYHALYRTGKISTESLREAQQHLDQPILDDNALKQWAEERPEQASADQTSILMAEQLGEYRFQQPKTLIKDEIFLFLRNYFGQKTYQETDILKAWHTTHGLKNPIYTTLKDLPVEAAIEHLLTELNIPDKHASTYLQAIYLEAYGWASLMHWRNNHPDNPWIPGQAPCEIILLIWLSHEYKMANDLGRAYQPLASMPEAQTACFKKRYIWQTAFELTYLKTLDRLIEPGAQASKLSAEAQFIFCIDTRSEGFRRHLEQAGNFETFGFAGFFGTIFKLNDTGNISYQSPALVAPEATLEAKTTLSKTQKMRAQLHRILEQTKKQLAAPFALFEMLGFWFSLFMLFKTLQPNLRQKQQHKTLKLKSKLPEQTQLEAAKSFLTTMGLTQHFSPWVLICAHQSDHINNPYQSSLNCGACGGNSGIPNALVMNSILNDPNIRSQLKAAGIIIPESTQFLPACHHTTEDRLEILEGHLPEHLDASIQQAAQALRTEKLKTLPGSQNLSQREQNWSELIPELGLINNTAIVFGPRCITQSANLERKVFLHSYEPKLDTEGTTLANLLSAPAIVAHWISSQYYFSTVNPHLFGAGNKAIHNVIPGIGVMEGNLSDLKIGLPLQSVQFRSKPMHEPRRLIVVVYAPKATLGKALEQAPVFKNLLDNDWVYLKHVEPQ